MGIIYALQVVKKNANHSPKSLPVKPVGTVAELFAGVGGFRLGLERAGWKTVFSNQWEPSTKAQHASDVYVAKFGKLGHSNEDISKLPTIPKVDLIVGGFPCQDYSVAKSLNSSYGLEGKKGVLWWEILRLVSQKKPKFIFLENVDRLLKSPSSQRGRDFAVMLRTLGDQGYLIEWRVVNAAEYGFPQRRIRVFIVARKTSSFKKDVSDYVHKDGILAKSLPVQRVSTGASVVDLSAEVTEISRNFNLGSSASPFLSAGVYWAGKAFTYRVQSKYKGLKRTLGDVLVSDPEVPASYYVDSKRIQEWEYLKGAKSIERIHKNSGISYNYSEGGMAFPDLLTNPSRTILTGEGGVSPSRFKHIIKTRKGFRRLIPVELERLNGFPDDWTKSGDSLGELSDARRAFFMGNALVVGLIERVGRVLAQEMRL
jgi:DNA (cytosine-5)-methyltransferase 1